MTTIGCARTSTVDEPARPRRPIVADEGLVHAFDTSFETRAIDRLELDHLLHDRDIHVHVIDGVLTLSGEVWTLLEKQRAIELVRHIAGGSEVVNRLAVRLPPHD